MEKPRDTSKYFYTLKQLIQLTDVKTYFTVVVYYVINVN